MWIADTIESMRVHREVFRREGRSVAFVPTMGALHEGHLSLMRAAAELADVVVASIYVNPTQFGVGEDFDKYPRPLEHDLKLCEAQGVAGVFRPTDAMMYPADALPCEINVPALAGVLEGEFRPTHFAGVCRVVAKLFNIVQPDVACFGRKDYQQLKVIEAMTADLMLPVRIAACPTMREEDGLAMSSRNAYLSDEGRRHALGLSKALREAANLVNDGESDPAAVEAAMRATMAAHHVEVDYAVVRHPHTLARLDIIEPALTGGVIALVAGRVDGVRLIDNALLGGQGDT